MPKHAHDQFGSINPPLYSSVAFAFNSVAEGAEAFSKYGSRYAYGRMGNPSVEPFERWLAEFQGVSHGSIWATNTGMSAIALVLLGITSKDLGRGKKVVASPYLYGGTYHLLEFLDRNGYIEVVWVKEPFILNSWKRALDSSRAACVLLETPANPTIDIFDIEAIAKLTQMYNSRLVVDDTLGVGLQWPLSLGADCAVYSVTKALNRKSSELGGAIVAAHDFRKEVEVVLDDLFVHLGMTMHPQSALAVYENRTTLVRDMMLFSENALAVAQYLAEHPKIKKVNYPFLPNSRHYWLAHKQMRGGGGLLSFEMESFGAAVKFVELQNEAYLAVHLGDGNNHLVTHPASTTHSKLSLEELAKLNITPELVRMSISLGGIGPLIVDFERALSKI